MENSSAGVKPPAKRGRPAAHRRFSELPDDLRGVINLAIGNRERPGQLYRRLQIAERGVGWHSFYHHYRRINKSLRGVSGQCRPNVMTPWADALAKAIVGELLIHYPATFVADIVESARRNVQGGKA